MFTLSRTLEPKEDPAISDSSRNGAGPYKTTRASERLRLHQNT